MSLVSVKNFIAPLTNKTHVATILLCTVVFALFRMQGGGISLNRGRTFDTSPSSTTRELVRQSGRDSSEESVDVSTLAGGRLNRQGIPSLTERETQPNLPSSRAIEPIPDSGSITITEDEEGDLIGQMIGKEEKSGANRNVKPPEARRNPDKGSGNSLNEIERLMGIR